MQRTSHWVAHPTVHTTQHTLPEVTAYLLPHQAWHKSVDLEAIRLCIVWKQKVAKNSGFNTISGKHNSHETNP